MVVSVTGYKNQLKQLMAIYKLHSYYTMYNYIYKICQNMPKIPIFDLEPMTLTLVEVILRTQYITPIRLYKHTRYLSDFITIKL